MTLRIGILLFAAAAAQAAPVVLFDGSLNTLPEAQGWTFGALGSFSESSSGGAAILTSGGLTHAGWAMTSPVALDRTAGYSLTFDLQLDAESHSSTDRAGLSLIVLGNDLKGIELGFWLGEVWAQNDGPTKPPRFTHGEGAAFDTTQATEYRLNVAGDSYSLLVGGVTLLSGSLRDYSPEGLVYTTPNFIFVGDDTTSAGATSRFFSATLGAPEPSTMLLGASSLLLLCLRTRRRRG